MSAASHAQVEADCTFTVDGPMKTDELRMSVKAEEDAILEAIRDAKKKCLNAGWDSCEEQQTFTRIHYDVQSTANKISVQYRASVASSDCLDKVRKGPFAPKPKILDRDCTNPKGIRNGSHSDDEPTTPSSDGNSNSSSGSSVIPGDGDGRGRRDQSF